MHITLQSIIPVTLTFLVISTLAAPLVPSNQTASLLSKRTRLWTDEDNEVVIEAIGSVLSGIQEEIEGDIDYEVLQDRRMDAMRELEDYFETLGYGLVGTQYEDYYLPFSTNYNEIFLGWLGPNSREIMEKELETPQNRRVNSLLIREPDPPKNSGKSKTVPVPSPDYALDQYNRGLKWVIVIHQKLEPALTNLRQEANALQLEQVGIDNFKYGFDKKYEWIMKNVRPGRAALRDLMDAKAAVAKIAEDFSESIQKRINEIKTGFEWHESDD